ncbi:hypothetical protein GCM10023321_08730 [Pseudonocardia eucalypti]|uniref:SEC-C motif-containing protein n=1 Tax=Pseudonocardia eucalypti TaxID=648755 RepID=A0ABP9PJD7_9PSEU|nr:tetratricopeptide (TPR) repeat protein [Pseudonocardia eucalypti]
MSGPDNAPPTEQPGRVFTHRLTPVEIEHDLILLGVDLAPLAGAAEGGELTDGTSFSVATEAADTVQLHLRGVSPSVAGELGAMLLPTGRLAERGWRAGDTVGLRLEPDGLALDRAEPGAPTLEQRRALWERLHEAIREASGQPVPLAGPVWRACTDRPELFAAPLSPLSELLAEGRFAFEDGRVAPDGFDFAAWGRDKRLKELGRRYRFEPDESRAVLAVVQEYHRLTEDETTGPPEEVRAALGALAEASLAEAVLFETIGAGRTGADVLLRLVDECQAVAPRSGRAALCWLRGKALERGGDVAGAEREFQAAEAADPAFPLALEELAHYAGDRGDAERALALLRRAGVADEDERVELLSRFHAEPHADLGRNEPCWCGSGRKYKQCHLRRGASAATLDERAVWLYRKAETFVTEGGPWRTSMMAVAVERSRHDNAPLALLDALNDPLCADAVLFEGGALDEFLEVRGALLPEDERELARRWLSAPRGLYEVQRARPVTLREARSGETRELVDAEPAPEAGTLVCARPLPAGQGWRAFGGLEPVRPDDREALLALLDSEPGPVELVAFLTRRLAPGSAG